MSPGDFQNYLIDKLRRLQMEDVTGAVAKAEANARRGYNQYECASCKAIVPRKNIRRDHTHPVVDPGTGFVDWNKHIARLFVPAEGFQILCVPCHKEKTIAENKQRAETRRSK